MVTIKDIAKLTNLSPTTVSRVLNNDDSLTVTNETREKILLSAKQMGYKTIQERKKKISLSCCKTEWKVKIFLKFAPSGQIKSLINPGDYIYFCSNY